MKNTVNMDAMKACAVLSGFNWYKVNVNRDGNESEFYATELEVTHEGATIKIHRQFATPEYMGGFTKITAAAENCIVFEAESMDYSSGNGRRIAIKYTVEGLKKDFSDPDQYSTRKKVYKAVSDLAEVDFINPEWTQYDRNNDTVILIVDPFKMGLTSYAEEQIKRIININLNGQGSEKQICRTVCFKVKVNDPYKKIYADVYDLEKNAPTNWAAPHIMEFNTNLAVSMKAEEAEKFNALFEMAQTVAAAM